jgi:hypothetical protein
MARPLNKKYFGNRNVGTDGTADNGIGGEGVGSVTIGTEGTYTSGLPTATFSTPDIPGGVRATGVVHGHALSAATTSNGTGYNVGDVLTVAGGTRTSAATFPVASITTLGTPGITNGGSLYDVTDGSEGDRITFTHANLTTALRVRVTGVSGSTVTSIVVEQAGIWNGTGAFPTSMADGVGGFTATTTARSGGDNNGNGLVLSFSGSNWGVYSFGTVAVQGDYTVAASNPASFTGGTGTGAAADITYGVSGIVVTQKGSGYTAPSDAAITFSGGTAAGTSVLTTDSGSYGTPTSGDLMNSNNQENAIRMTAYLTGGSASEVDIIKQVGAKRFKVTDGTRSGVVTLQDSLANAAGEGSIGAVDSDGGTYFITKIAARRATVTRGTGTQFATGQSVPWNMTAAVANVSVKISNA